MFSLEDKHLIKALPKCLQLHMDMFTNFVVCYSHKMFIKCLIFIKFVDFLVFSTEIFTKNDFKFYKVM